MEYIVISKDKYMERRSMPMLIRLLANADNKYNGESNYFRHPMRKYGLSLAVNKFNYHQNTQNLSLMEITLFCHRNQIIS